MTVEGFVKVTVDQDGTILGCHLVGPAASTLVEVVVVAMKAGWGTVRDVRESVHVHPALSAVVQRAFAGPFTRRDDGHGHNHEEGQRQGHDHSTGHGNDPDGCDTD